MSFENRQSNRLAIFHIIQNASAITVAFIRSSVHPRASPTQSLRMHIYPGTNRGVYICQGICKDINTFLRVHVFGCLLVCCIPAFHRSQLQTSRPVQNKIGDAIVNGDMDIIHIFDGTATAE